MKIAQIYSHLNGLEYLIVHKNDLLQEIKSAIQNVDASETFDKVSKEKNDGWKNSLFADKIK
ncbi:MAG: hypothetical protein LIO54_03230 [Oscillospiraceae bacterium]|nr:hypothetical protein [Oscillospiraceae bacterium]